MQNANRERNGGPEQWGVPPLAVCGRTAPHPIQTHAVCYFAFHAVRMRGVEGGAAR